MSNEATPTVVATEAEEKTSPSKRKVEEVELDVDSTNKVAKTGAEQDVTVAKEQVPETPVNDNVADAAVAEKVENGALEATEKAEVEATAATEDAADQADGADGSKTDGQEGNVEVVEIKEKEVQPNDGETGDEKCGNGRPAEAEAPVESAAEVTA